MSLPLGPNVYPTALMRSGLWCVGLLGSGRMCFGMACLGSIVSGLSSCRPSCSGCGIDWRWGEVISSVSVLCLLNSVACLLPRSCPIMGQRPPLVFWSIWCRSRKVLLCRVVISFVVCLQPPSMWVIFRGIGILCKWVGVHVFYYTCVRGPPRLPRGSLYTPYMGL